MKKAFKIIGIVVAVLGIAVFAFSKWSRSHSPQESVTFSKNGLDINVNYCKPSKKGRVIFGELVPFQKVWRTGANEATTIEFKQDVLVAGKPLKSGKYSLWTIPTESDWTIIFNEETGQWGTSYDDSKDVLKIEVPSEKVDSTVEQFKIEIKEAIDAELVLSWENTAVVVPVVKK